MFLGGGSADFIFMGARIFLIIAYTKHSGKKNQNKLSWVAENVLPPRLQKLVGEFF